MCDYLHKMSCETLDWNDKVIFHCWENGCKLNWFNFNETSFPKSPLKSVTCSCFHIDPRFNCWFPIFVQIESSTSCIFIIYNIIGLLDNRTPLNAHYKHPFKEAFFIIWFNNMINWTKINMHEDDRDLIFMIIIVWKHILDCVSLKLNWKVLSWIVMK